MLRWLRVLTALLWIIPLACASRDSEAQARSDREIVVHVLRTIEADRHCTSCLVEQTTQAYELWVSAPAEESHRSGLAADLISSYAVRNERAGQLPSSAIVPPLRAIGAAAVGHYFENGPSEGWERLRQTYGDRVGLIRMSLPGYSRTADLALITYSYDEGPLAGETNFMLLKRVRGGWAILQSGHLLMS